MSASLPHVKVLFVITKSNWGGAQRYVYDLACATKHAGGAVTVAVSGDGELVTKLTAADIATMPLSSMQRDISVARDTGGYAELARVIGTFRPGVVHLNSSKAGGLGALAARMKGVPRIIFTAHGWPFEEKRSILWRAFALLGSYATALLAHDVIVVSAKDLAIGKRMPLCARKMHLIHNGIDLSMPLGSGAVIRDAFPPGAHITGTIGELNQNKNQAMLIAMARKKSDMYVAIVGEGEERTSLEEKIRSYKLESRVKLFGFLPAAEVLAGFDEFALPSRKEGLPYVLIEARAAGLPIRANPVGGVPDIVNAKDMSEFSLDRMVEKTLALYQPS